MLITIDTQSLKAKVKKSVQLLETHYHSYSGKGGWYHYLDSDTPGATASAVGLMIFKLSKNNFDRTGEVLSFLKTKQLESGGWAVSTMPDQACVESSAWVIKCLSELHLNLSSDAPDISKAYEWIKNNINDDNGWGSFRGQPSRTYLTCMAMKAIAAVDPLAEVLKLGEKWLLANKNKTQLAWGATASSTPTVLHTAFVLLTLSEINCSIDSKIIDGSLQWIFNKMDPNMIVESASLTEDYNVYPESKNTGNKYQNSLPHFALPIAISALLRYENFLNKNNIYQGLLTISNSQQEDGHWENARNPIKISIWAIFPFVQALSDAINLPVLSSAKSITKVSDSIILRTHDSKKPLLFLLFLEFVIQIIDITKKYWSVPILILALIICFILLYYEIITQRELLLSLIIPVFLSVTQLLIQYKSKS